ncbi:hypothetical protein GUJ93_ZPchr0001g30296 [Zizania palustris]|uniref:Trichome birefringence-like C-terminal domain-containing protein n=1 Tax=Zizania palustris TaxID=103762 RepID=A0A8J5V7M0_ZIZPA|nr:hypothetical protein GUJ93_ZPchr0001g30296 [Zizania palustris]
MVLKDMDRTQAFTKALSTSWARWVDANLVQTNTRVFFQSISPSHYRSRLLPSLDHHTLLRLGRSPLPASWFGGRSILARSSTSRPSAAAPRSNPASIRSPDLQSRSPSPPADMATAASDRRRHTDEVEFRACVVPFGSFALRSRS